MVLNKVRGNPSKWFYIGGAWKTTTSDPSVELDIPTGFRERNPDPRILVASDLSFDFSIVWERVRNLPDSSTLANRINDESHQLAACLFRHPRHLGVPEIKVPRFYDPPPEAAMKNPGVLERMRLLMQQSNWAPAAPRSDPEVVSSLYLSD
ncbi:hypothetical protein OROHE_002912 [Orobanche hederae]